MNKYEISYGINTAKLIFIYVIVVFHTRLLDGIVNHGYIGVEFFFIVSGMFLFTNKEVFIGKISSYLKKKILKLYPHYVFSAFIMFIVSHMLGVVNQRCRLLPELFWIQNLGIFPFEGYNYPCWYISVWIWSSMLLIVGNRYFPKSINSVILICLPLFYILCSVMIYDGRMEIWDTYNGIYLPFFRGMSDLCIGIGIGKSCDNNYKISQTVRWGIEIFLFFGIIFMILCPNNADWITVFLIAMWVRIIKDNDSILGRLGRKSFIRKWTNYEYAIYLNHAVVILVLKRILENLSVRVFWQLIMIIFIVSVYSIFTTTLFDTIKKVTINKRLISK